MDEIKFVFYLDVLLLINVQSELFVGHWVYSLFTREGT